MRRAPSAVLLSVLVPLGLVLPVASAPHASAHPVAPEVRSQSLHGVQVVGTAALRGSARATFAAAGRPEVLVRRTGLASFDLLGVTWRAGSTADLDVLARTHGTSGWSEWTALDITDTPSTREARKARPGTEPLWVGDSDGYQVRVDVRSGRLPA